MTQRANRSGVPSTRAYEEYQGAQSSHCRKTASHIAAESGCKQGTADRLVRGLWPHEPRQALTEVSAAYPAAPSHKTNEKKGFVGEEEL